MTKTRDIEGSSESGEVHKLSLVKGPSFCHLCSRTLATTLVTGIFGSLQKHEITQKKLAKDWKIQNLTYNKESLIYQSPEVATYREQY